MFHPPHIEEHLRKLGVGDEVIADAKAGKVSKIPWADLLAKFGPVVVQLLKLLLPLVLVP